MSPIKHPSEFLSAGIADRLRQTTAAAEAQRDLHPDQLALIYEEQWFRMLLPPDPLTLPALVRLEEGISWADGAVGWTVTLCSGAGWFAGFFPATATADASPATPPTTPAKTNTIPASTDIFSDPHLCLAGSGSPSGEAHIIDGGYKINGHWDYASGALHATAFTANCIVMDKGKKVLTEEGAPLIRPFLFRKEEVTIDPNWNTIGLVATGSHAFAVRAVTIPADRCFTIDPAHAKAAHPIYRYPFLQLAEATLAANLSGMGMHFIDCCDSFFKQRIQARRFPVSAAEEMNKTLEEGRTQIQNKREEFYSAIDRSWEQKAQYDAISRTSRELTKTIRNTIDQLYPYGGLGAARPDTEINRVWRDLHTASQHSLLVFSH